MSNAGFSYTLTRTLDAPIDKVWAAWTTPEIYGRWASAEEVALDVRTGGVWSSVMVIPGGARVPLSGTYAEVVDRKRLVMGMNVPGQAEPVLMTAEFAADGDRTQITLSQDFDTAQDRDQAEQGSNFLLDGLAAHLATT
ncbi:SRPBCC family protein [Microtetraspora niveoalba]|uniref:SRPBCC family protein n=1 Tax=Microtetraspora niveoalba TaxID=46175 RepID=UPI00082FFD22|nr:SRPBCC domain-containing protein [Microtetraspora niveoalba]